MSAEIEWSSEEVDRKLKKVESTCICRGCPTYKSLAEEDDFIAYCFPSRGRSRKISEEKGCTCGVCPVYGRMKFMTSYFCTRGIEMKQKEAIAEATWKGHSVWDHLRSRHDETMSPRKRTKMTEHSRSHLP